MDLATDEADECLVYHAMAFDAGFAGERLRNDEYAEMAFTRSGRRAMPGVHVRFI